MGAKQSKRSVDISGKEAEGASEVAAAGAGGEGRVEPLADADALKPQLNGDAHIHEKTDKEKELDSGTPENEKDATTEKETKQEEDKEAAPVTNGETEQKVENGETTPTSEDGKKPKKEKVKKKWSLRSISFSRKDKPKQEKKKEDEAKTNGEPEKVPEETNEVAPEAAEEATTEEAMSQSESKPEERTPETPVTEPITNGTTTPESPKIETPLAEEPIAVSSEVVSPVAASPEVTSPAIASPEVVSPAIASPEPEKSEPKPVIEPEQLPVNGLSLEDSKESPEVEKSQESKLEEPAAEKKEIVPETPVIKEVCVDQMPLIEPTPPPLPANPPPSSVASFAATTMAPELTDASLANTAVTAIPTLPADSITKDAVSKIPSEPTTDLTGTQNVITESLLPNEPTDDKNLVSIVQNNVVLENKAIDESVIQESVATQESEIVLNKADPTIHNEPEIEQSTDIPEVITESSETTPEEIENKAIITENIEISVPVDTVQSPTDIAPEAPKSPVTSLSEGIIETQISEVVKESSEIDSTEKSELVLENTLETAETKNETNEVCDVPEPTAEVTTIVSEAPEIKTEIEDAKNVDIPIPDRVDEPMEVEVTTNSCELPVEMTDVSQNDSSEELPPPPPPICDDIDNDNTANMDEDIDSISEKVVIDTAEVIVNSNHAADVDEIVPLDNEISKDNAKLLVGKIAKDSLGNVIECNGNTEEEKTPTEESAPEVPPAAPSPVPQDPLPTCDKLSELIPEVPAIPEFKTETESPTDVAVAN